MDEKNIIQVDMRVKSWRHHVLSNKYKAEGVMSITGIRIESVEFKSLPPPWVLDDIKKP